MKSDDEIYVLYNKTNLEFHSEHSTMKSVRIEQTRQGDNFIWTTKRNYRINVKPRRVYFILCR